MDLNEQIAAAKGLNEAWLRAPQPPRRVLWLMPDFVSVHNGGPNTILRFAHYFARGAKNVLYVFNASIHQSAAQLKAEIGAAFGYEPRIEVMLNPWNRPVDPREFPPSDLAVATLWHTAYLLLAYEKTKAKAYLVQDYETRFYPGSVDAALADLTYDFGLLGLFNTPGLRDAVQADHAMLGHAFQPGIDHDVFYPGAETADVKRMFFYGRPEVPRNGFNLGVAGLRRIQAEYPDVEVSVAGHPSNYGNTSLRATFLPYMDYRATGDMYRDCGSVLSFMFTPHPSYIPLQAMSCGAVPIARRDPFTGWALEHMRNCLLVDPLPNQILEAYANLRRDKELYAHLRANAVRTFEGVTWEEQLAQSYQWLVEACADLRADRQDEAGVERLCAA